MLSVASIRALDAADTPDPAGSAVVLQALDKITARVQPITVPIGTTVTFGTLAITPRQCNKRPPDEPPDAAAFLEIAELLPDQPPQRIFSGWMFASTPALNALEHPVYDIWVLDCR
jgi:hypothetical protein